jgi:hypothetical protein
MKVWQGTSQIDGKTKIAVYLTGGRGKKPSANRKTGAMVQAWIMAIGHAPHDLVREGADQAVCGACPHSGAQGRTCYVRVDQAPLSIWRAHANKPRGRVAAQIARFGAMPLRIGAYGDPAAVPVYVWRALLRRLKTPYWTGYTHQWERFPSFRDLCMASVDSAAEADRARSAGWRTFRVTAWDRLDLQTGEIECPADSRGIQCIDCGLCDGARMSADPTTRHTNYLRLVRLARAQRGDLGFATPVVAMAEPAIDRRKSIVIKAHGRGARRVGTA